MRGALVGSLMLVAGCVDREAPMDPEQPRPEPADLVADANGCHGTASLDGSLESPDPNSGQATFGPFLFGQGRFCLHLDATNNRRAHLMIETDRFDGEHSPISMVLERPDGTVLVEGWDVAFGQTDTKVFTNLEMAIEGGTAQDVVLVVDADGVSSEIGAALFDPLD